MILNASEIIAECEKGMITPFEREKKRIWNELPAISYGVSSFGYDIHLSPYNFKVCTAGNEPLDPMKDCSGYFQDEKAINYKGYIIFVIPPNTYALAQSIEKFNIPDDIHCIAVGKSTYARCGLVANITPLESGWRGILTLELNNNSNRPVIVYAHQGIAQLMFFRGNPTIPYSGTYQDQKGTMFAKVSK